ncbi:endonuclease III [Bianquea renquensis]|uniref:Endonuclease III n=1 Tax=Bianquea renquensis TaxID=2763661 RepID=A0A926I1H8_9FIRM|nr:endonuclease III [Bianquea renquensis]MBC8543305.1 endonuclease III [Bianquea renquensis]
MTKKTERILQGLREAYPDVRCELNFETPLQLLTATVLSAQTTDRQVNKVTEVLFRDCPGLEALLALSEEEIAQYIHTLGFYNTKARNLFRLFRQLADQFGGEVPRTMEELTTLPGVGRKTANVVMSNAFGIPAIAVDTHVFRVSNRIGLANATTVEETEKQLQKAIRKDLWSLSHHLLIFHGRRCCSARGPKCEECGISQDCRQRQDEMTGRGEER